MSSSASVCSYGTKKTFCYRYEFEPQDLGEFLSDRYQIHGERLEEVLSTRIKINQKQPLVGQSLETGDLLEYDHFRVDESAFIPGELEVLHEDENLLVIAKPAGVPVSPSGLYYFNALAIHVREVFNLVELSPLHRLDLETSGVLMFGKHKLARQLYQKMFAQQKYNKRYLAVTLGNPGLEPVVGEMVGATNSQIYTKQIVLDSDTPNSRTEILSVKPWGKFWLVELKPVSGKTNQLRVHLAHRDAAIVGDKKYYPDEAVYLDWFEHRDFARLEDNLLIRRQALHCAEISFDDPFSGEYLSIKDDTPAFYNLIQPLKDL